MLVLFHDLKKKEKNLAGDCISQEFTRKMKIRRLEFYDDKITHHNHTATVENILFDLRVDQQTILSQKFHRYSKR